MTKDDVQLLRQLDETIGKLENKFRTDREEAIYQAGRLLISLTHDEFYNAKDAFDRSYLPIADYCRIAVES